jgi:hypothetical protein
VPVTGENEVDAALAEEGEHVPRIQHKVGVWPGNEVDDSVFRRDTAVSWAEGEEGFD